MTPLVTPPLGRRGRPAPASPLTGRGAPRGASSARSRGCVSRRCGPAARRPSSWSSLLSQTVSSSPALPSLVTPGRRLGASVRGDEPGGRHVTRGRDTGRMS